MFIPPSAQFCIPEAKIKILLTRRIINILTVHKFDFYSCTNPFNNDNKTTIYNKEQ